MKIPSDYGLFQILTSALIVLCLLMLAGCSPAVRVQTVRVTPPDHLLAPRAEPVYTGTTYRDALIWSLRVREAYRMCELDKAAVREWAE